jgi:NTE family protein
LPDHVGNGMAPYGKEERRVGLALGSGAARGWAHIGVLRALAELGWEPAWVAGSSMGAFVAAAYAVGRLDTLEAFARGLDNREVMAYLDVAMPVRGLLEGDRITRLFRTLLGTGDLERTRVPLTLIATDLATGSEVRLRRGSVAEAVRASIAVPGIFAPAVLEGRYLVDGGLVNPVPVDAARELGAHRVIAVDLNHGTMACDWCDPARPAHPSPAPGAREGAHALALASREELRPAEVLRGLGRRYRELETQLKERALNRIMRATRPNIFDVIGTSINIVSQAITREKLEDAKPDVIVRPVVSHMNLWEFSDAGPAIEAGYRATLEALAEAPGEGRAGA